MAYSLEGDPDALHDRFKILVTRPENSWFRIITTLSFLYEHLQSDSPQKYLEHKFYVRHISGTEVYTFSATESTPITIGPTAMNIGGIAYSFRQYELYIAADREEERIRLARCMDFVSD